MASINLIEYGNPTREQFEILAKEPQFVEIENEFYLYRYHDCMSPKDYPLTGYLQIVLIVVNSKHFYLLNSRLNI